MAANVKAIRVDSETWHGREPEFSQGFVQPNETPSGAMSKIGTLDTEVNKVPLTFELNGQQISTGDYRLVLTNTPWGQSEVLNRTVSDRYHPIQNRQLANIFDQLVPTYQLATVGNIGQRGQISFIEFKDGEYEIGGLENELHKPYFLIGDNKEMGGTYFGYVTTRVVCENTWSAAITNIKPLPHSQDSLQVVDYVAQIQHQVATFRQNQTAILNEMFNTKLSDVNSLAKNIFSDPKKSKRLKLFESTKQYQTNEVKPLVEKAVQDYEKTLERVEKRRQGFVDTLIKTNDENPEIANTVYSGWVALTDYVNHSNDFNGQGVDQVASLLFGTRETIQNQAWQACEALV